MAEPDRPKKSPSETPRVDAAERFMYTARHEPVGYVMSLVARSLEIELNHALAALKNGLPMGQASAALQGPATPLTSTPQAQTTADSSVDFSADSKEPEKSVAQAPPSASPSPAAAPKVTEPPVSEGDDHGEESGPLPEVIQPTKTPEGAGESVEYENGQILFNKGDSATHLAIVLEGSVEIFDPVGNTRLALLGAGSSFGEQAILEGGIRGASVKAAGKVKCLEIKIDPLREVLKKNPGLLLQTIEGLLLQLSMCNQISTMIATPGAELVYELLGDERLTSIQLQNKLNDAYKNPDSHGLSAEQMMYLKLQSSDKLMSSWFESGKTLGSPTSEHRASAYVIAEGSVEATCGNQTIRLGHGSVMGLAEGITGSPFSWTLVANNQVIVKSLSISKVLRSLERANPGIKGIVRYTTSRILELQKTFGL